MKEIIKMYHIFFPNKKWLWVLYVLYPVMTILLGCVWIGPRKSYEFGITMGLMCVVSVVDITEYLLDVFSFGAVAARGNAAMEYFRASNKGMRVMKTALILDGIRRIATTVVVLGAIGWYALKCYGNVPLLDFVQTGFSLLLLIEGGVWLIRKYNHMLVKFMTMYFSSALACGFVPAILNYANPVTTLALAIVLLSVMVITRVHLMKRGKENYYDNGFEKKYRSV